MKGLPAIVVGIKRGTVTPGDGRPLDMTEIHALSGMFFTLPVVVGLSLLLPPIAVTAAGDQSGAEGCENAESRDSGTNSGLCGRHDLLALVFDEVGRRQNKFCQSRIQVIPSGVAAQCACW